MTPIRPPVRDPSASSPLRAYQTRFVAWTLAIGLAEQTGVIRRSALNHFIRWCHHEAISQPTQLTRDVLERYQGHLHSVRKSDGTPLAPNTRVCRLNPLKAFTRWLVRSGVLDQDPAAELIVPRVPRRLPGRVPTVREMERILRTPDTECVEGLRDRAILEVLYSTGMRRMEVVRLAVSDLYLDDNAVIVRSGKGNRDRVIPLGARTARWVCRYLEEARECLMGPGTEDELFISAFGEPLDKNRLGDLVRRYIVRARVPSRGACHLFRHACATHMLENGADIRFIQALLGHADLSTTQIYTSVAIGKLKEVHAATHPTAREASAGFPHANTTRCGVFPMVTGRDDAQASHRVETV